MQLNDTHIFLCLYIFICVHFFITWLCSFSILNNVHEQHNRQFPYEGIKTRKSVYCMCLIYLFTTTRLAKDLLQTLGSLFIFLTITKDIYLLNLYLIKVIIFYIDCLYILTSKVGIKIVTLHIY